MSANEPLVLHVAGTDELLRVSPARLVVAGYTAKDEAAVAAHIEELAGIGVPPPDSVPAFYDLDPGLLTTHPVIEVGAPSTSGEVEPVVLRHGERYFLGVGSDHTDRQLERVDVFQSKACCPKPLGGVVAEVGTDLSTEDWDSISADCTVDGQLYQNGSMSTLRHPAELCERMVSVLGEVSGDVMLYCGTLPLVDSEFVYGSYWRVRLELPGGLTLTHAYETKQRSI